MSDDWYRTQNEIPPYRDYQGFLWTIEGECLNPVHGCERPDWLRELDWVDLQADVIMSWREFLATHE